MPTYILHPRQEPHSFVLVPTLAWPFCQGPSLWRVWHLEMCPAPSRTGAERRGWRSYCCVLEHSTVFSLRPQAADRPPLSKEHGYGQVVEGPVSSQEASLLLSMLLQPLRLAQWPHFSHFPGVILSWVLWAFQIEATSHKNLIKKTHTIVTYLKLYIFPPDLFGFASQPLVSFVFALLLMASLSSISFFLFPLLLFFVMFSFPVIVITSPSLQPWGRCCPGPGRKKESGPIGSRLWKFL